MNTPISPTTVDVSDGSDIDLRIRGCMKGLSDLSETWLLYERDFNAFCTWIGADATRQMFRDALALAEETDEEQF